MPLALVTKWLGASRCVPTCRVEVISIPPTPSKATRLIHLICGPPYREQPRELAAQARPCQVVVELGRQARGAVGGQLGELPRQARGRGRIGTEPHPGGQESQQQVVAAGCPARAEAHKRLGSVEGARVG